MSQFSMTNLKKYLVKVVVVTMLEAVEFPASIADLASSLAHVDGDALTLKTDFWLFLFFLFHFLPTWIEMHSR